MDTMSSDSTAKWVLMGAIALLAVYILYHSMSPEKMTDVPATTVAAAAAEKSDVPTDPEADRWQVPVIENELAGKNFLEPGVNINIDTVGQSLKNANYQIRSEPPNPILNVSPWNVATVTPDLTRRRFDIA